MSARKRKPGSTSEHEITDQPPPGVVPPVDVPPPPPAPPPPPTDPRLQILEMYGLTNPEAVERVLVSIRELQAKNNDLEQKAKADAQVSDKTAELKKEAEDMKVLVAHGQTLTELRKQYPGTSLTDLVILSKFFGPDQAGTSKEIEALRRELAETKQQQALGQLESAFMQRIGQLEARIAAQPTAPASRPGFLGAVDEIKAMVQDFNNLKAALKEIGIVGEGGKNDSLASAIVDKLGASVANLAAKAGWDTSIMGLDGKGQQKGPPPAPEDRPPTQDEFDQAALEWFRGHAAEVLPGQVKMNDEGFLMGNGPEIQTYLKLAGPLQGVQPYVMNDGHYMIPPDKSRAFLEWVRNLFEQAQGGTPPKGEEPPKKKDGDKGVRPGF